MKDPEILAMGKPKPIENVAIEEEQWLTGFGGLQVRVYRR